MENQTEKENNVLEVPKEDVVVTNPPGAPSTPHSGHQYAGFWIRFLAVIIDGIIISIISKILHINNYPTFGSMAIRYDMQTWSFILNAGYLIGFWVWKSATPGKMVLGLKIIEEDGKNLTWQKAVIRYLAMIVSAIPFCLGFIWAGFNPKKQGWHDLLAKTYVVKSK